MTQQRSDIFEAYRPLRNHLGKCGVADSLEVIRAYAQNLQFNGKFPPDIEALEEYASKDHTQKTRWVSEWNLEILAKEVIINSSISGWNTETFKQWSYFSRAINKIKDIEGVIAKNYLDSSNILRELERMAHGQFGWQIDRPSHEMMARYYRIFNTPEMSSVAQEAIGLSTKEIYFIGVAFIGFFIGHFALHYPPNIQIPGLTQDMIEKFVKYFSSNLESLREKLITEQNINENYFYAFSSLRRFPLVGMDFGGKYSLVCPLPTLLFWRITSGLYYEVFHQKAFDNAFGESFQKHIGDCVSVSNVNGNVRMFPEERIKDGKRQKDTVDWIVDDGTSAMFVECKAKRMTISSKSELVISDAFEKDIEKMASFVVQIYKTIRDYRDGKYPSYPYNQVKQIYPIVVTLEDWHLFGDNTLLAEKVKEGLNANDIPLEWLSEMPFTICSTQEFEEMIQVVQSRGIDPVVGAKVRDPEKSKWAMGTFLPSEFPEEHKRSKFLFPDDFDSIFPEELNKRL